MEKYIIFQSNLPDNGTSTKGQMTRPEGVVNFWSVGRLPFCRKKKGTR